jgi:peptidoglycan/LPS O-acetylase OafA/YrhL
VGLFCAGLLVAWRQLELAREIGMYGRVLPTFFVRSDTRMDALLWGAGVALVLDYRSAKEWAIRYVTTAVWVCLVALYVAVWFRFRTQPTCWEGISAALLVGGTAVRPSGPPGRALELAPLRWIGRISYSIYLSNNLFIPFHSIGIGATLGLVQQAPFNIAAVAVSSTLLYYLVERPMIRRGRQLASGVRRTHSAGNLRSASATPSTALDVSVS